MQVGAFTVEFIRVNHSIIDGAGIAIGTPVGTIIHSGDFKIDYSPVDGRVTDIYKFAEYGESGVQLLMSDSTNALRKGYTRSESILSERLFEIFSSVRGRIIVRPSPRTSTAYSRCWMPPRSTTSGSSSAASHAEERGDRTEPGLPGIPRRPDYRGGRGEFASREKTRHHLHGVLRASRCRRFRGWRPTHHRHFAAGSGDTVIITASVIPGTNVWCIR